MITQKINLNLIPNGVMPRVNVSQYDYGSRTLEITLYNGSSLFTIPTGAQIVIQGTKKDNRGFQYVDLDYSGSVVTADITQQMTVFEDEVQVELVIITGSDDNKQQLATANFILNVEQAALKDDIVVSETDIPAIQTLPEAMAEVNYAVELLEQVVPSIEGSVEESEAWARGTKDNVPVTSEDAQYHNNSKYYAEQASGSAGSAGTNALNAEAFGAGTRNGTDVTSGDAAYQNNAKYYAGQAGNNASAASGSATSASASAEDAEAYGIGKRGGVDVESGDVAYHNNSKYYAGLASNSANNAGTNAETAEAYAKGTRSGSAISSDDPAYNNNSKYYSEQASGYANTASDYVTSASAQSDQAQAWATGEIDGTPVASDKPQYHNSAKYWADQASQAAGGGVTSFNGRTGSVSPADGDYDITQIAPTSGATEGQVVVVDSNGDFTVDDAPSSGHTIKDDSTTFTQRSNLQFTGNVSVSDDSTNNATVVEVTDSGHEIIDSSDTSMTQRTGLQFGSGFTATDDSENDKTIITPDTTVLATQEDIENLNATVSDSEPYINRQAKGNLASIEDIVGGTIAWNQLFSSTASGTINGITKSFDSTTGLIELSGEASTTYAELFGKISPIQYHKYAVILNVIDNPNNINFRIGSLNTNVNVLISSGSNIISVNNTYNNSGVGLQGYTVGTDFTGVKLKFEIINLTAMFGSTIADYIYSLEQANAGDGVAWFRQYFPNDYYAYDTGSLQSVKVNSRKVYDANDNLIATYPFDSTKEFRGIPKLVDNKLSYDGDIYKADGTVTRKYGIVDLGTLNWRYDTEWSRMCAMLETLKLADVRVLDFVCVQYASTHVASITNVPDKSIYNSNNDGEINIHDSAYTDAATFKTAMSGVYLVYPLENPTTEPATSYQNPQRAFINGTEEFVDADTRDVAVPVGNNTIYQKNETLPATLDYVDARVGIITFAPIKTFAAATDEEIAWMVKAADEGLIDLYEDCGWRVGQEHKTTLEAIAASGTFDGVTWSVGETQPEQIVTLVLLHRGLYELVTPVLNKDGSARNVGSFVYGLKNMLETLGHMNSTNTMLGSWRDSARRGWCNGGFRQAMPEPLRRVSKQFKCITGDYNGTVAGGTNITTQDYFALAAEKELFGSRTDSTNNEFSVLTQFKLYETESNRIKHKGDSGSPTDYWERSINYNNIQYCGKVSNQGAASSSLASAIRGLSPIGVF